MLYRTNGITVRTKHFALTQSQRVTARTLALLLALSPAVSGISLSHTWKNRSTELLDAETKQLVYTLRVTEK